MEVKELAWGPWLYEERMLVDVRDMCCRKVLVERAANLAEMPTISPGTLNIPFQTPIH